MRWELQTPNSLTENPGAESKDLGVSPRRYYRVTTHLLAITRLPCPVKAAQKESAESPSISTFRPPCRSLSVLTPLYSPAMTARVDKFKFLSQLYFFLPWSLYSVIHHSRIFSPALSSSFLPVHSAFAQMAHNQGALPNVQAHKCHFFSWYLLAVTNCKVRMPFLHPALTFQVITTFCLFCVSN